jgi:hypothetical protein
MDKGTFGFRGSGAVQPLGRWIVGVNSAGGSAIDDWAFVILPALSDFEPDGAARLVVARRELLDRLGSMGDDDALP